MKRAGVSFLMSKDELNTLKEVLFLEPFLIDVVNGARKQKSGYKVYFPGEDMDEAIHALEFFRATMCQSDVQEQRVTLLHERLTQMRRLHRQWSTHCKQFTR